MEPLQYSFPRYLASKKSVDDRALNRTVWQCMAEHLPPAPPQQPLRILDVGAGTGVMLERMLDWGLLGSAHYTALDEQPENTAAARQRLAPRMRADLHIELETADVFGFIPRQQGGTWDLLAAHAFLDLVDIPSALPALFSLLRPEGFFYFSLNFDGLTLFEPEIDRTFDDHIQAVYHRTMDERRVGGRPSGDSRSGRHLFGHLRDSGAEVLAAGASDWVVFARRGAYPHDEAYFLHFIIHTVYQALLGHPEVETGRLVHWIKTRRAQIERGELVYIAHQVDFFGRGPGFPGPAE
jgi:SAM-dependent methyltransferase